MKMRMQTKLVLLATALGFAMPALAATAKTPPAKTPPAKAAPVVVSYAPVAKYTVVTTVTPKPAVCPPRVPPSRV